ncbi:hypothetical protein K7432_012179 [Basidiobolus ranarum]|uniref:AN1-type domain-containing protein n=1 Tax=Basidiobolus ranarum TaxID=34480 RepID=A0ABR2VSP3_9FUNG
MELPHIGKNCALNDCNQLDFLPYKCHLCKRDFCQDHWRTENHQCPYQTESMDVRVPVCPLCAKPVPVNKGENPNRRMDEHIRNGCKDAATTTDKSPAYKNACSYRTCKTKVLVSAKCPSCQKQYCLKHRFEVDHDCPKDAKPGGTGKASKRTLFNGSKTTQPNARKESHKTGKSKSKGCAIS